MTTAEAHHPIVLYPGKVTGGRPTVEVHTLPDGSQEAYLVPDRIVRNAIQIKGLSVKFGVEELSFSESTGLSKLCKLLISLTSDDAKAWYMFFSASFAPKLRFSKIHAQCNQPPDVA